MNYRNTTALVAVAFACLTLSPAAQQTRDRAQVPEKYKWDLTPLYPTDQAWRAAKERAQAAIPSLGQFKGKLGSSAGTGVAAPTIMTTNDMPIVHPESFESLGLVPDTLGLGLVDRAAIILALADEIEARCPRGARIAVDSQVGRNVTLSVPLLPSWLAKDLDKRFERAFGRSLIVRH